MKALVCILAVSLVATAAENPVVVIVGEISDSQCAFNVHSNISSHEDVIKAGLGGRNSKQCTRACVRMGGKYVLVDSVHKKVYHLANPEKVAEHAAMRVRVHGFIDKAGAISITEIETIDR